jgi:chemosensory pili system protein ChpA (sensor histidine kinase/response regulator)
MFDLDPGAGALPGKRSQPVDEIIAALQAAAWDGDQPATYGERLERMGDAAEAGGLPGLRDLCLLLQQSLASPPQPGVADAEGHRALAHFAELAGAYVRHPSDRDTVAALIATLRQPPLAVVQSEEDAACLAAMLLTEDSNLLGEPAPDQAADAGLEELQFLARAADDRPLVQDDAALPSLTQVFDLATLGRRAGSEPLAGAQDLAGQAEPAAHKAWAEAASDRLADLSDALQGVAARVEEVAVEQRVTPQTPLLVPSVAEPARAAAVLPPAVRELIDVMIGELPEVDTALATFVGLSQASGVDTEVVNEAYERAAAVVERFGAASASVGFSGLEQVCAQVVTNLQALQARGLALDQAQAGLLQAWSGNVRRYLEAPLDASATTEVLGWLGADAWPQPVGMPQRGEIERLLRSPDFGVVEAQLPVRPTQAHAEDVALTIPEDVNQDLLDGMLQELPTQAEEFSAAIQRLISGGTLEDVQIAQRISHTIKGAGNTVGVTGLANLAHHLEDILLVLARTESLPVRSLAETLMNAADCLESMSEALVGGGGAPREALGVLQDVLDWANRIDREGLPRTEDEDARRATPEQPPAQGTAAPREVQPSSEKPSATRRDEGEAAVTPMLRVPAELVDELLRLVGETIILTGQIHQRLDRAGSDARAMQMQFDLLQQLGGELEELVDVKDLSGALNRGRRDPEFDALEMDQYNELHTCSRRLVEAALDARQMGNAIVDHLSNLDDMLVTQESLNRSSQEAVLRTRMVPVKSVFPRLQRSLRQACRMTRKQAVLNLSGGDTLMDGDVLVEIVDALMHLLRNAVDHGIEDAATRQAAGKDPVGQVFMDFLRDGNSILVRCRDDGAGLDLAAIKRTAGERGIVAGERELSEGELKRLILRPNFTTRTTATQVSGRGIGLDAVNTQVARLGGGLSIDSVPGGGCTFELRLPFTLISSHALLVRTGQHVLALASRGIEQILHAEDGKLQHFGSELIFHSSDRLYRAVTLESIIGMGDERRQADRRPRSVILVRAEAGVCAVLVESVLESRDLVVKHLGRYLPKLPGVIGATILGDGSVTPVIDLPELLRAPQQAASPLATAATSASQARPMLPTALVVDDSLSARRALAQVLSDAGYEVRTARDGLEAVEVIEVHAPDILLVDMEMPRMNGIELTAHVRSRAATARLPVIMVTSRSTSKHRQQAEAAGVDLYLTKPFAEDQLLEHVQTLLRASHAYTDQQVADLAQ